MTSLTGSAADLAVGASGSGAAFSGPADDGRHSASTPARAPTPARGTNHSARRMTELLPHDRTTGVRPGNTIPAPLLGFHLSDERRGETVCPRQSHRADKRRGALAPRPGLFPRSAVRSLRA